MSLDWQAFLAGLERHVRANPWHAAVVDATPAVVSWEASPPATDAQVEELQGRLGAALPPSYVAFLRASNGLTMASHPIGRLLGTHEVSWFRKKHGDWIRAYTATEDPSAEREPPDDEYFSYADDVRPYFRPKQFRHTIMISAVGDGAVYLLNPQVVWPSGEWEAWFLANWHPGVVRFRSFAELMWEQYGGQTGTQPEQFGWSPEPGLPTVYQDPPGKPGRKAKKLVIPKPPRPLDRIARDVRDGDLPTLQKAIKELARLKTPEGLELLGGLLRSHPVHLVREDAAHALGSARRSDAVPVLIEALGDEYYGTAGAAAQALGKIRDGRAVGPLLQLLEKRGHFTFYAAAQALAEFKEPRAAESIGRLLRSHDPRDSNLADNAGVVLAQFGEAGLKVLLGAMETGDATAKLRALRGASYYPKADVESAVCRLASDPDNSVRASAAQVIELLFATEGAKRG